VSNNAMLGVDMGDWIDCHLDLGGMPGLDQVCVWTTPFPPEGLLLCADGSPNVNFTDECSK